MGLNLPIRRSASAVADDQSWLGSKHGTQEADPITLDGDSFLSIFPDGVVPSGVVLGRVTATGLYRRYSGTTEEVQTLTVGGSGLTSFTITWSGQTTGAIAAAASAATVQAALEALSNVAVGDVVVTGDPGGVWTVVFGGVYANTDVAAMTTTPTGGTGVVTVATTTAGGADAAGDGTEVAMGHLLTSIDLGGITAATVGEVGAALYWHGEVVEANLPVGHGLDPNAKVDLKHIRYV